jgi:alpha-amylase
MSRLLLLFALAFALAACGGLGAQAPTVTVGQPGDATPPAATALAPAQTAQPTRQIPPTSTPDPRLPTAPPRITPGPTAAPFPLEAGWWDSSVCYEVFVRSFYDSDGDGNGDLQGLIQKLDYINDGDPASRDDLGANCIWLMPVAEAASYHGYDTLDYYTVEQDYGTNEDFKALVREAEARGIKIVIDLVINHTSSQHPWFQEALRDPSSPYRDWYLWSQIKPPYSGWHRSPVADEYYYGLFWSEMPDLNYRNPAVTAEAQKISRFWVEEMGAAGFRMDAIKHLFEYLGVQENRLETHEWLREYRAFLERELPGTYTIGEIFGGDPSSLAPYFPDQLDYYFEFDVAAATRGAADVGLASLYMQAVQAAYNQLPYQRWAPFLTNHDQNRVMNELDDDPVRAKLAALALLTLPGQPYLYYGEELGMLGVKPDENIRTPMQWTGEPGAGFTSGQPWRDPQPDYETKNVAAQADDPDSLLSAYRELVHLHVNTPSLGEGDFVPLSGDNSSVAAFLRLSGDDRALVVINFDAAAEGVTLQAAAGALPPGTYTLAPLYGAPEGELGQLTVGPDGAGSFKPLAQLPAQTGYIFRLTPAP